jgi:hypothetical protein
VKIVKEPAVEPLRCESPADGVEVQRHMRPV